MPQLDIYRALDEIILILVLLIAVYLLMLFIVIPLLIKRIGIQKSNEELKNILLITNKVLVLKHNLELHETKHIIKL